MAAGALFYLTPLATQRYGDHIYPQWPPQRSVGEFGMKRKMKKLYQHWYLLLSLMMLAHIASIGFGIFWITGGV